MKKLLFIISILISQAFYSNAQNIANGDFEKGPASGWTQYSKGGYGLIGTAQFFYSTEITPQVFPRSGQYMARIGGFSYEENYIKQTVILPNTPKVYMGLYYQDRASTNSECAGIWVGAQIRVIAAGQIILDQYICYYNTVSDWTYVYFDLSAASGQTIEIAFRADAANSVWSYLYLDDISFQSTVPVQNEKSGPQNYFLLQNYPNPFNPATTISYQLPKRSYVTLKVYNILGNELDVLVNKEQPAGSYDIPFIADKYGLGSGVYFYKITAGEFMKSMKMMVLK